MKIHPPPLFIEELHEKVIPFTNMHEKPKRPCARRSVVVIGIKIKQYIKN